MTDTSPKRDPRVRWKKLAHRSYLWELPGVIQAFVFGASRPVQMWAWCAYWECGSASGVCMDFQEAKRKAEDCLAAVPKV